MAMIVALPIPRLQQSAANTMKSFALSLFAAVLLPVSAASAQAIKNFKFEVTTLGGQKLTQDDYKRLRVAADRIAQIMEVTA